MSDSFWKNLNAVTGLIALTVLFGLISFSANLEIKDLDLWLHLKTGQYILEHHAVPAHDILSCSLTGKPWVNHEWLFQIIMATVHHAWGFDGLINMQVVIVSLTFLVLLVIAYRRDRQWIIVYCLLLMLLVYQSRFTIRLDIFSLLFFALYVFILSLHLSKSWSIWVLAIIQILWVNMHGYFVIGPMLVFLGVSAEFIKRRVPLPYEWNTIARLSDEEYKRLKIILATVLAVCLINPLGLNGLLYPIKVLFQAGGDTKIFFKHIYELQRPFAKGIFNIADHVHYKILVLVSFLTFFFNRRKIDLSILFLWLVFLLFSLVAIRNMVFFACAAYIVILANSMTISLDAILPIRFTASRFKDLTGIAAKIILIVWMLNFGLELADHGYFDYDAYERKSEYGGVSKRNFPYQAVDFLVAHKIKGNFFNDFNSGAYLIGRTYPNIKVFIDGRTEVYGGEFFNMYQKVWQQGNKKVFEGFVEKHHLTGAFLNGANQNIPLRAVRLFHGLKDWQLVYFNYDGMIFLKKTPQNQPIIDRFAINLEQWKPPSMDLQRLGPRPLFPFHNIDRAKVLVGLKFDQPALKEINEALKISPNAAEIYQLRGDVYARQRKYRKAFEDFRVACAMVHDRHNRLRLAWGYERLHDPANALKQYERLLAEYPKSVKIASKIKKLKEQIKKKIK